MSVQESTVPEEIDYRKLQLKVGLEVHQQLSTREKLFCSCPPLEAETNTPSTSENDIVQKFPVQFTRVLRAASSELGETDLAAKFEARQEIRVRYLCNGDTSCLVEADEEPPHPINQDALDTALIFALALKSKVIDEIHVMRKIVVDGSNTSGFQRTTVVALGGYLEYNSGNSRVGVQSISLEEDAARAIKLNGSVEGRAYILDRLGTPLVEVALAPIEGERPDVIRDVASSLGRLIRSSGRTARGLGTIRQDLNISVLNGAVIEVKGVQRLEQISKVVEFEAARQKFFYELRSEIQKIAGKDLDISIHDVTEIFRNCKAKTIRESFAEHGEESAIFCIKVKNYSGFFAKKNQFQSRLGKELAYIARTYGLGGVFHSDELPNYGITEGELQSLRANIAVTEKDGFVLLTGSKERVKLTTKAIVDRIKISPRGIPAETRAANPKGETTFLRPRPGAARMYPETDIPLILVTPNRLHKIASIIPEPWDKQVSEFGSKYQLSPQLASQLFDSDRKEIFVNVVNSTSLSPGFVAYSLIDMAQNMSREGVDIDHVTNKQFQDALFLLDQGKFAKEALPKVLSFISSDRNTAVEAALGKLNLGAMTEDELLAIVKEVISANRDILESKGPASQGTIMGKVMERARGRIDGRLVSETVSKEIKTTLGLK